MYLDHAQGFALRPTHRRKIAVVGTGISGLSAAWLLHRHHDVTCLESGDRIGGHSHTVDIELAGKQLAVDTGFIVYNPQNYPNLTALFKHLDVPTAPTDMSFSVSLDDGRFEYSGGDGAGLLAQPSNLLRPRFWRLITDLLRFYREAGHYLEGSSAEALTVEIATGKAGPPWRGRLFISGSGGGAPRNSL